MNHDRITPRWQPLAEILLIFAIFFLHGAFPVPDSNEAHYLAKAKHYWQPAWAGGDFFLESADAHQVFYWTFGWLTLWMPLDSVAWVGRVITWLLLAWSWQRLSAAAVPRPWFSLLTAAVFVGLNENAHMAGEWVIGGVEAKGFAYALVFFALERVVRQHWRGALLLLGLATAFHVLVGGWAAIAAAVAWLALGNQRPGFRTLVPAIALAIALSLPSIYFAISLTGSADAATVAEANRIYVFERLSHHLSAAHVAPGFLTRHLLLQAVWLLLATFAPAVRPGDRALRWFVAATIAVSWIGLGVTLFLHDRPEWLAAVLRYYWFRASDAFAPLGVALALTSAVTDMLAARRLAGRAWLAGMFLIVGFDTANQISHLPFSIPVIHEELPTPRADKNVNYRDWVDVCEWMDSHTEPDAIVLTPRSAATFKWRTGRAEVATWKDVPQDAISIVQWWTRMNDLYATGQADPRWYASFSEQPLTHLRAMMEKYRARYVIVPLRADIQPLSITPMYKNESFAVYQVDQLDGS